MPVQPVFFGDESQRAVAALPDRFARFAQRVTALQPLLRGALAEGQDAIDAIAALERQRRGEQLPAVEGLADLMAGAISAMGRAPAADCWAWALDAVPASTRLAMPCKMAARRNRL